MAYHLRIRLFLCTALVLFGPAAQCLSDPAPAYGADRSSQLLCERYVEFIPGGDDRCKQYGDRSWQFDTFSSEQKAILNAAFTRISALCPALIDSARRGGRIPLALSARDLPEGKEANTFQLLLCLSPSVWRGMANDPQNATEKLAKLLTHELTHMVDFRGSIACLPQWTQIYDGPWRQFQQHLRSRKPPCGNWQNVVAEQCSFPSLYATRDPRECLAESTAALVFDRKPRLPGADAFVQAHVLRLTPKERKLQTCMHAGFMAVSDRRYRDALSCFRQATELEKNAGDAFAEMGRCYAYLDKPQDSLTAFDEAMRIFTAADFTRSDKNVAWIVGTRAELLKQLPPRSN